MQFGTWTPTFPDYLLATTAVVSVKSKPARALHTFANVFQTSDELIKYLTQCEMAQDPTLRKNKLSFGPVYVSILKFLRAIELKPQYWTSRMHTDFSDTRQELFTRMLVEYEENDNWQMVVTPETKRGKKEFFSAGMPVRTEKWEKDVEAFMFYSDWYVNPKATHAAMYAVEDVTGFDWPIGGAVKAKKFSK